MKRCFTILLLSLIFIPGPAKSSGPENPGRAIPSVSRAKINEVVFIGDISPELWLNLSLSLNDRVELEHRRRAIGYFQGYYYYSSENFDQKFIYYVIDYVSVEISVTSNGKTLTSQNSNDKLTTEQKNMLHAADLNTDINIKIKFKFKNEAPPDLVNNDKIIEGTFTVMVVPESEAEYPGGLKQMTNFLAGSVRNKIPDKDPSEKIMQAIVNFTVNEEGQVVDAKISRSTADPKIDKLLLDALHKMPKWRPAENSKGVKVKQQFTIPLGGGC